MGQIKIYGIKGVIDQYQAELSTIIHQCVVEALQFPEDKKAHRFIKLDATDFYYPAGRTDKYIILEIYMMEGRTTETKKKLIRLLFDKISEGTSITQQDIEIAIFESAPSNWGFRGFHGDEVKLNYKVAI